MELRKLPAVAVLSDNITIIEKDGIQIVRVIHDKAEAGIALHGGHVLWFKPTGQEDLIWLSEKAEFNPEKALRGGIPVCWPWFGTVAAPSHGFVRTSPWHIVEHRETENGVLICLGLEESEESLAIWPNTFQARLYVEIAETLKVTLDVTNTDDKAWKFSGALHTYLNIADIRESVTTGMGGEFIDKLQNGQRTQGGTELQLTDTVDRVYTQPEDTLEITDPKYNRTITVTNCGHNSAVIWNPWETGSKNMADMADDGYNTMLCVESVWNAASLEEGKTLQPGESHQLITEIAAK